jgi:hypothetical protein
MALRLSQWFEIHKPPVDSNRPVSANCGHSWTVRRTGQIDPELPFESQRERRPNAVLAPQRIVLSMARQMSQHGTGK